jgi:hypothetical protein
MGEGWWYEGAWRQISMDYSNALESIKDKSTPGLPENLARLG